MGAITAISPSIATGSSTDRLGKQLAASAFAAIREKEPAGIGDAFKTGLTRKITVSRPPAQERLLKLVPILYRRPAFDAFCDL